jgi:hypothetical protein
VIALSSQAFVLNDGFSIASIWLKIVARAAPTSAFPLSRVDLHRIEQSKRPSRTRKTPFMAGLLYPPSMAEPARVTLPSVNSIAARGECVRYSRYCFQTTLQTSAADVVATARAKTRRDRRNPYFPSLKRIPGFARQTGSKRRAA